MKPLYTDTTYTYIACVRHHVGIIPPIRHQRIAERGEFYAKLFASNRRSIYIYSCKIVIILRKNIIRDSLRNILITRNKLAEYYEINFSKKELMKPIN